VPENQSFNNVIKLLKESKQIDSLKDLANKLDLNYTYLSRVKNGRDAFSANLQNSIADIFDINKDVFINPDIEWQSPFELKQDESIKLQMLEAQAIELSTSIQMAEVEIENAQRKLKALQDRRNQIMDALRDGSWANDLL